MVFKVFQHNGVFCSVFVCMVAVTHGLTLEFLESLCGTTYNFETSFQLDSGTGITYKNLLDCSLTITAPSGHNVLALVTGFELEAAVTGTCTDYLDVHNGSDTSAAKLNPSELCGWGTNIPSNFTSSGQSMTLRLVTDSQGVYHGFNIVFTAVYDTPCTGTDFACSNQLCVDSSVRCDNYNQCGDNSDEANCESYGSGSGIDVVMVAVITAVVVLVIAIAAGVIIYKVRDRSRWKKFVNSHVDYDDDDGIVEAPPSYPITHMYYKGIRGHPTLYTTSGKADEAASVSADNSGKAANSSTEAQLASSKSNIEV